MHTFLLNMQRAVEVGAKIETILQRNGILTENSRHQLDDVGFAVFHTAQNGNVVLGWSVGYDGEELYYLAVDLHIETSVESRHVLQQFKLLHVLGTQTWHRSTAGYLGFSFGGSDFDEAKAMQTIDRMARYFSNPQRSTLTLLAQGNE